MRWLIALLFVLPLFAAPCSLGAAEAPFRGGGGSPPPSVGGTMIVPPSGGDDTAPIQTACNKGAVQLTGGVYHVTAITCKAITGMVNADDFFWYQGQQPTVKMVGTPAGKRGVVTCPSPGPCTYQSFTISPPAGTSGIVLDSVHGASLLDMNIVDDQGGNSSHCVDMVRSGEDNQNLVIRGGTYIHCGGWCVEADVTSDGQIIGADIANCQKGGVHIAYGYGWRITGNYIQGGFAASGFVWDCCGDGNITGNHFDENWSDMVLGSRAQDGGVYLSASGNSSCRTQGGAMFEFAGSAYVIAAANISCGPTYYLRPGTVVGGGFYDPNLTNAFPAGDNGVTRTAMTGLIH